MGKSSIQKEVQKTFTPPYLRMGFDDLAFLPTQYISVDGPVPPADQGIWLKKELRDNHPIVTIHYGNVAQKMVKGIHKTFAAFAQTGNNIIVDYIAYYSDWIKDLTHVLHDYTVYFIGINAPLEVLETREKEQGNRLLGHARSHYDTVYKNLQYDLEIDTSQSTPEESAELIKQYIQNNPHPQAFKKNA